MTGPAIIVLGPSALATAETVSDHLEGAAIHGFRPRLPDAAVSFDDAMAHIGGLFRDGAPVIGICSAGILIRAVAPHLGDKHQEPPVLAIAEDGTSVMPLLGGHRGANDLARDLANHLGAQAAITTAGDLRFGTALDAPPEGWTLSNPQNAKAVMAGLLAGEPVSIEGAFEWLDRSALNIAADAPLKLVESVGRGSADPFSLIYHPRRLVVGVGCDRGCPTDVLGALVRQTIEQAGLAADSIACIASIDRKADEPAIHALAETLGVPARFFSREALLREEHRLPNPSATVKREVGVAGVAEAAALAAAGETGNLIVEKRKNARATCAVALANRIVRPENAGRARGCVSVVGIGPGAPAWRSREASQLLAQADDWVGYGLYLDLCADIGGAREEHRFPLGAEEDRVRFAFETAAKGRDVALICSGDPGIYAMAALVYEVRDEAARDGSLPDAALRTDIAVAPGISALQAAAARIGAPLGHDFCAISLSDLLTPWEAIEKRLHAAATGDFVVALYNPRSERRRHQLLRAIEILAAERPADTPVTIATNLGRPGERLTVTPIADFDPNLVDMLSLVLVGSSATRAFQGGDGQVRVYTPRGYAAKRDKRGAA